MTDGIDTDALRDALRIHHPIMRSETGPFSGCRCGQVGLGEDVIAHVVAQLRAVYEAGQVWLIHDGVPPLPFNITSGAVTDDPADVRRTIEIDIEDTPLGRGEAERLRQVRQIADNLAAASRPPILNDFDRGVTAAYADVAQQLHAALDES